MKVHPRNLGVSKHNVKKHLSHALEISCSNWAMDIFANRRRWLAHWIDTEFEGNRAKAAQATGYSRSQISQFLSETYQEGRSPQERAARSIEAKFGKRDRIMETPAPTVAQTEAAAKSIKVMLPPASDWGQRYLIESEPPEYVREATLALLTAYHAGAPRELFDSVRVIFSLLAPGNSASIKPSHIDEKGTEPPAASPSSDIRERAAQEEREAESHLATRGGVGSGTQGHRVRKGKGAGH